MTNPNKTRKASVLTAAVIGVASGCWWWRHARSPKVQAWRPSVHPVQDHRPLAARTFGSGRDTIVLLHGLGATGDYWDAAYDTLGESHRVLIPDLLGFGRSLDERRTSFSLEDHLDALDLLLADQAPGAQRITVVAHSMGSAVALAWAVRHPEQVHRVLCAGAPVYPDAAAARDGIGEFGPMARIFLLDTRWAERACALSCANRTASGLLAALIEPSLPVPVTRRSVLHTWPAYRDALNHLVLEADWPSLLTTLANNSTPVTLIWGDRDRVGDRQVARQFTSPESQTIVVAANADHHLPMTDPPVLIDQFSQTPT